MENSLVSDVQEFWFNNVPGPFMLGEEEITREQIHIHGGPIPRFTCPECQRMEWLSRVRQKNLFVQHGCSTYNAQTTVAHRVDWPAQTLCERQGSELWTQLHQNFEFAQCCRPELNAPKCAGIFQKGGDMMYRIPRLSSCDRWAIVARRWLAQACQLTMINDPAGIDWDLYDFAYFMLAEPTDEIMFDIPIPFAIFSGDIWYDPIGFKKALKYLQPMHIMAACPCEFNRLFEVPEGAKVYLYPLAQSQFLTRPNLGEKDLDLITLGCDVANDSGGVYYPRFALNEQVRELEDEYRIMIHNKPGSYAAIWDGEVFGIVPGDRRDYLNGWSTLIGSARYSVFGRVNLGTQPLFGKYYEILGSGAIPILPESPDFNLLGIRAFEHYIPLSMIENDNDQMRYYLDNYDEFRYIAVNAVRWHEKNVDRMIFDDSEKIVREMTDYRYPRRVVND